MPVNPAVLSALTLDWSRKKAQLDDQENRRRINYNSALDKMRRNYDDTSASNLQGFSDRGMLHSGASLATGAKLRDAYNRGQGETGLAFNTDLATIARRRQEEDSAYNMQRLLASLGLTQ